MKVIAIPLVIGALGTIPKGSIKKLEDLNIREQMETIQLYPDHLEYCEASWRVEEICCLLVSSKKP